MYALFIYHINYSRKFRQATQWKSGVWQYHLSVRIAELLILLSTFDINGSFFKQVLEKYWSCCCICVKKEAESVAVAVWRKKMSSVTTVKNQCKRKRLLYKLLCDIVTEICTEYISLWWQTFKTAIRLKKS